MIRVKSVSDEGVYYLVNGWKKHKAFWLKDCYDPRIFFKDMRSAKTSITKLMKIMPDYLSDKITYEYVCDDYLF